MRSPIAMAQAAAPPVGRRSKKPHFDGRERIKCDWEAMLAKLHRPTGHSLPDECGDTMDAPADAIEFIGTIEVRPSGASGGGEIGGVDGASGPSGESQEIGRRCDELAFG